ncbi:MAG: hypothetical protein LBL04_06155 [Bacteroidales bacterium]|nr:hypothetical protein [Bacteroidales bacterium]
MFPLKETRYPLWQRLVFACYSLVEYTVKLAFPANLLYVYPFPMKPGDALPAMYLIYPPVAAAAGIALYRFRRYRVLPAGVAFFIVNLVLTLHIIPMSRFTVVADRYVYLASAGSVFHCGVVCRAVAAKNGGKREKMGCCRCRVLAAVSGRLCALSHIYVEGQ